MLRTLKRLDVAQAKLFEALSSAEQSFLGRRPAENEWSVLEVFHHLCLVQSGVLAQLKKSATSSLPPVSFIRTLIPLRIVSWRLFKVSAPKIVQPQRDLEQEQLLASFNEARKQLKEFCEECGADGLRQLCFRHPFFGNLSGLAAVEFVSFHEVRHLKQIQETLRKLQSL